MTDKKKTNNFGQTQNHDLVIKGQHCGTENVFLCVVGVEVTVPTCRFRNIA